MNIHWSADAMDPVYDLDPACVPSAEALRSDAMMDVVELGAGPRMMATVRYSVNDVAIRGRSKSPLHIKQKAMEAELEKLNKHLSDQISEIQEPNKPADEKSEDNFPPSKKAQELQEFLEQEYMENQPPNINNEGDQRSNDKKKSRREKNSKSPIKNSSNSVEKDMHAKDQKKEETCLTDISTCAQPTGAKHVDNVGTLFSIPEDSSFEQSPSKAQSDWKSFLERHTHKFDSIVMKFYDKLKLLRAKSDQEKFKEDERFKKMKMLLTTMRKGLLSDKAISDVLKNVSFEVSDSETSPALSDVTVSVVSSSLESDASTHISDSSSLNESSIDSNIKLQVKKYPESVIGIKKHVMEYTSTDSSDFSNVVERISENKSEKRTKDRNGHAKGKKVKVNENENNKNSKDKQNKDIFGVGLSEKNFSSKEVINKNDN